MRYIEVRIGENLQVKEVIESDLKVVAESKRNLVVQGRNSGVSDFNILDKEKAKRGYTQFNSLVEDISVRDYSRDKYFKEHWGLFVLTTYTNIISKKIISNKMTKALNKHIKKQQATYGHYSSSKEVKISL